MFGLKFGAARASKPSGELVVVRLNARLQPIERGEFFEDPLDEFLRGAGVGEVTGGGTQLGDDPIGVEFCEVELVLGKADEAAFARLIERLEAMGAPKGSTLRVPDRDLSITFGNHEGLGLFLNGVDLPDAVYAESDVNVVIATCEERMAGEGAWRGHWQGERETALYFYGASFAGMKAAIEPVLAEYPLCRGARVEQIA